MENKFKSGDIVIWIHPAKYVFRYIVDNYAKQNSYIDGPKQVSIMGPDGRYQLVYETELELWQASHIV